MERTIVTQQTLRQPTTFESFTNADAPLPQTDSFQSQFLKLIPIEVISAYITIEGLLEGSVLPNDEPTLHAGLLWGVFAALGILNPFYLRYVTKVKDRRQVSLSAGAFVIYVLSLGGPFAFLGIDEAIIRLLGSILIPIYTLTALIVLNK